MRNPHGRPANSASCCDLGTGAKSPASAFSFKSKKRSDAVACRLKDCGRRQDIPTEDHMLTKRTNMPFLSLHTLAAARGDGLHPEFVKLFTRLAAGADATLYESAQPPAGFIFEPAREGPASNKQRHKWA